MPLVTVRNISIIGQGVAGTALGWALEEAGVDFRVVADTHDDAASRVAAGLINPVTGQRFVKNWRIDELLPLARAFYRQREQQLGVQLWHDVEIRRYFANELERARARQKFERGELAPYISACDEQAIAITGAAWVDLPLLLAKSRERWRAAGQLVVGRFDGSESSNAAIDRTLRARAILCVGTGELVSRYFPSLPVVPVKGEIITVESDAASFDVHRVLHGGVWIRPDSPTRARVGATYEPGVRDRTGTTAAREDLLRRARELLAKHRSGSPAVAHEPSGADGSLVAANQDAGVRLAASDRLPVAGWSDVDPSIGILGALASKGALWAPWLAGIWARHLASGSSLEDVVSPQRFERRSSAVE